MVQDSMNTVCGFLGNDNCNVSLKVKEYLKFEVLEGEAGNSFYGSRLGSSFRCSVEVWFYGTGFYGYRVCGFLDGF